MGHVEDVWMRRNREGTRERSTRYGVGSRWMARWVDPEGRERSKTFGRKVDAERFLSTVEADMLRGTYVDTTHKVTFREYAEKWRAIQVHRPTTAVHVETMLRRHAYPTLGARRLPTIQPSDIQAWAKALSQTLAPSTVAIIHGIVSGIFKSAVRDRLVLTNPCEGTRLPKAPRRHVVPLATESVLAIVDELPERLRAAALVSAGTGLRQGEVLGLTLDRVDFLRREVRVDRQLVTVNRGEPFLGPPKTKASTRTVPLPQTVVEALAEHVRRFPPVEVALVDRTSGQPTTATVALLFTTEAGEPWRRNRFGEVWRPAVKRAGVTAAVHDLRHYYASLLIQAGESVKVVQSRLGHASAMETLDTYAHLWPDTEDSTRAAVDLALRRSDSFSDVAQT